MVLTFHNNISSDTFAETQIAKYSNSFINKCRASDRSRYDPCYRFFAIVFQFVIHREDLNVWD